MREKTAIETIRTLKRNAENDMPEYDYGWDAAIDEAIKALAALDAEKPAEDWRTICDVRSDMMRDCAIGQYLPIFYIEQKKEQAYPTFQPLDWQSPPTPLLPSLSRSFRSFCILL